MRSNVLLSLSFLLSFAIASLTISSETAASTFTACVAEGNSGCAAGPSPAADTFTSNVNGTSSADATAYSTGGILGGSISAIATGSEAALTSIGASFISNALIDDLIITGPGPSASVQVSANIDGTVDLSGALSTSATANVDARLRIRVPLGPSSPIALYSSPLFDAPTNTVINTSLTTSAVVLPTNTNLEVELRLEGTAVVSDDFNGSGSAIAVLNFSDGLNFPSTGPVFTLPAGYTANSVSGNIVDNQFVAPGDFDVSGTVDGYDFLAWQRGESPNPLSLADLNAWEANYGFAPPLSALVSVPEPSCSALALAACCLLFSRCRHG